MVDPNMSQTLLLGIDS